MFALIDVNNFYVSCEKVFNPKLEGKPVIILSNNDGCIISRSDEAKSLGLKMAEPAFNKKQYLKENNVQAFSSNYTLYGDMSNRIIQVLKSFSPRIEVYSIDESFIELPDNQTIKLDRIGVDIKKKIRKDIGVHVSVGIGKTKALAKIANKIAKKEINYNGVCILSSNRDIDCALRNTRIEDVWGIGRQYQKFLKYNEIHSAYDFISINDNWIRKNLTVVSLRLKKSCKESTVFLLKQFFRQRRQLLPHVALEELLQM